MAATETKPTTEVVDYEALGNMIKPIDPEQVTKDLFKRVLDAPDFDAALDVLDGKTSQDFKNQVFTFDNVELQWYAPRDRETPILSARADAIGDDGEVRNFWTSSQMCVALLAKAKLSGSLPVTLRVVENTTSSGMKALNFERP